jgi:hypothetical protein
MQKLEVLYIFRPQMDFEKENAYRGVDELENK